MASLFLFKNFHWEKVSVKQTGRMNVGNGLDRSVYSLPCQREVDFSFQKETKIHRRTNGVSEFRLPPFRPATVFNVPRLLGYAV